ncbi:hypothetical protein [Streptomyces sp. NBC_00400]|uniref:hypothetical protein n=1 Tax=Streptomyces sp. NBC_00400 TaxID=2975737 RepID=UPI003FA7DC97
MASVGLTEAQARAGGHGITTARFPFAALGRAHAYGATDGMVKVVADRSSGAVLGTHIIGPGASDLIAEAALAVTHGVTLPPVYQVRSAGCPEPARARGLPDRGLLQHAYSSFPFGWFHGKRKCGDGHASGMRTRTCSWPDVHYRKQCIRRGELVVAPRGDRN